MIAVRRAAPRRAVVVVTSTLALVAGLTAAVSPAPNAHAAASRDVDITRLAVVDPGAQLAIDGAGDAVAYTADGQAYLRRTADPDPIALTPADAGVTAVAVDGTGDTVVFVSAADLDVVAGGAAAVTGEPQAYVAQLSDSGPPTLTRLPLPNAAPDGAGSIAISSDGTTVAFAGNAGTTGTGHVYIAERDTNGWPTDPTALTTLDVTPAGATHTVVHGIALSADASTVAAVVDDGTVATAGGGRLVVEAVADGAPTVMPSNYDVTDEVSLADPPSLTADGATVLVATASTTAKTGIVVTWTWRTGAPQDAETNGGWPGGPVFDHPSVSANGEYVAYTKGAADGENVYGISLNQPTIRTLASVAPDGRTAAPTTGAGSDPAWALSLPVLSADGLTLAFRSDSATIDPDDPALAAGQTAIYLATLPDGQAPRFAAGDGGLQVDEVTQNSVHLSWPDATDDHEVVGYQVTVDGAKATLDGRTVSGLPAGSTHTFAVRADDVSGNASDPLTATASTWTSGAFTTTPASTLPAGMTGLGLQVDDAVQPAISGNGRYVAFVAAVIDHDDADGDPVDADGNALISEDGWPLPEDQLFLTDTVTGTTTLVTHQPGQPAAPLGQPRPGSLALSHDGRYLAYVTGLDENTAGAAATVQVFDRTTGTSTTVPTAYPLATSSLDSGLVRLDSNGDRLLALTCDPDDGLSCYAEVDDWQGGPTTTIPMRNWSRFAGAELSPDGTTLALAGGTSETAATRVVDVASQTDLATFDDELDVPSGFSSDGDTLLFTGAPGGYDDPTAELWHRADPTTLTPLTGLVPNRLAADGAHGTYVQPDQQTDDEGDLYDVDYVFAGPVPGVAQRIGAGDSPVPDADGSAVAYLREVDSADGWYEAVYLATPHDSSKPVWPDKPALTATDVGQSALTLSWSAASDDVGVTKYLVRQDGAALATVPAGTTSYRVTGLSAGTGYGFAVVAEDAAGNTSVQLTITATTQAAGTTPGQDTLVANPNGDGTVSLNWDAAPSAPDGYAIFRGTDADHLGQVGTTGDAAYRDTGLLADTAYTYRVDLLGPDGSTTPWTATATVTTPAITISGVSAVADTVIGTTDTSYAAYGSTISVSVTGQAGRTGAATIGYQQHPGGDQDQTVAGSASVPLTESATAPGHYTGTWTIAKNAFAIDTVTGALSDGTDGHDASTSSDLDVAVSGAVSVTVSQPAAGSLAGSTLYVRSADDEFRAHVAVDGPGNYTVPTPPGIGTAVSLSTPNEADVATATADIADGIATAVQLTPVLHATLTVTVTRPLLWAGECTSDMEVTVTDDAGTTLGDQKTGCYQSDPVVFRDLPIGARVTVTSTPLDEDPITQAEHASLSLTQTSAVTLTHTALPTATLTGAVMGDDGTGTLHPNPPVGSNLFVTEHVDGKDWNYSTSVGADSRYSIQVLAGTASIWVEFGDGYSPSVYTATVDLAPGTTVTHDITVTRAELTVHVLPPPGVAAGSVKVTVYPGTGQRVQQTIPDGQTDAVIPGLWWGTSYGIAVDVQDTSKPIWLHYTANGTLSGRQNTVTIQEQAPAPGLNGLQLTDGTVGLTSASSDDSTPAGLPVLDWTKPVSMQTTGCSGGVATASIVGQMPGWGGVSDLTDFGDWSYQTYLLDEAGGTSSNYGSTLRPVYPMHGKADLTSSVECMPQQFLTPGAGSAGTTVYATAAGLTDVSAVSFGGVPATSFASYSGGVLQAVAPPGSGTVTVTATTPAGDVTVGQYTYSGQPAPDSLSERALTARARALTGRADASGLAHAMTLSPAISVGSILSWLYRQGPGVLSNLLNIKNAVNGAINDLHPTCKQTADSVAAALGVILAPVVKAAVRAALPTVEELVLAAFAETGPVVLILMALTPIALTYIAKSLVGALLRAAVEALFSHLGCPGFPKVDALIDPSGTVLDTNGNPVEGATVTLLRADHATGPFSAMDPGDPGIEPGVNPEITADDGVFHWDVRSGYYEIQASKPNCTDPDDATSSTATTGPYPVPPPQVGLVVTLKCPDEPAAPTPAVTALSATVGPVGGGTSLIVTGHGFTPAATVDVGDTPAGTTTFLSPDALAVTTPAGTPGWTDVTVHTAGGTSAPSSADRFFYGAPPTITAMTPSTGPVEGGTTVTITGTGLTGATVVGFGGRPGTGLTVNAGGTRLTVTTPPQSAGSYPVVVVTPAGTSPVGPGAPQFSFEAPTPPAKAATTLTVDQPVPTGPIRSIPALLDYLRKLFAFLAHPAISAHLTRADTGAGIAGQPVLIQTRRGTICTAQTDTAGTVTCRVPWTMTGEVIGGRVHAGYAGSDGYLPSSAGPAAAVPPAPKSKRHRRRH